MDLHDLKVWPQVLRMECVSSKKKKEREILSRISMIVVMGSMTSLLGQISIDTRSSFICLEANMGTQIVRINLAK